MEVEDIAWLITTNLDITSLEKIFMIGLVPGLSIISQDLHWWHKRVEVLARIDIDFSEEVDWHETYLILDEQLGEERMCFSNTEDNITVTKILLAMKFDPTYSGSLCAAASSGSTKILKLLLEDGREDPSGAPENWDNYPLILAVMSEHLECVKLLLQDERVDPSVDNDYAIQVAFRTGNRAITDLLVGTAEEWSVVLERFE